ncbi:MULTISPECIES: class I SAM-dependent methyltransferase [Acinetobacter]|uniref:SAM-dependent methyltransferase n=1 Tax=Acinetobacter pittii TaxID=48296 RepID=A0A4Q7BW51_ACIPI|nr:MULTISPECIES: class I SAM-dependent methyltransferase [Acinetobacter]AVZ05277.1 class I SAM-dependent methyltransferase [Acinetobacter pittii]KQE14324.1 SAM-dependent methyltransferase [Acinetobacter pittii]MBN6509413.1 class I SAM-dependent methyltransferase [Acinetobacter pittii]MBT1523683.1 class I SAM-dependent methyltransferase [Acinetobacter pittii]MCH2013177.1 class I SAM-dependent methyltransferase [Acinetobacter pittii]
MAKDFNSPKVVEGYDEHIRKLIPGYEVIHQQVDAILQSVLPPNAHILIVGCGTGYELEYLLKRHPNWKFTAVDPSLTMLKKAQEQVELLDKSSQVTFVHGETSTLPLENCFDAALSILVAHFIADDIKPVFFKGIYDRLKEKAVLLTYDLMTCVNPQHLQALRYLCLAQGLTEEQCQKMLERMAQDFFSLTTEGYIKLLEKTGFESVHPYTQILTYQGFIAKK